MAVTPHIEPGPQECLHVEQALRLAYQAVDDAFEGFAVNVRIYPEPGHRVTIHVDYPPTPDR